MSLENELRHYRTIWNTCIIVLYCSTTTVLSHWNSGEQRNMSAFRYFQSLSMWHFVSLLIFFSFFVVCCLVSFLFLVCVCVCVLLLLLLTMSWCVWKSNQCVCHITGSKCKFSAKRALDQEAPTACIILYTKVLCVCVHMCVSACTCISFQTVDRQSNDSIYLVLSQLSLGIKYT